MADLKLLTLEDINQLKGYDRQEALRMYRASMERQKVQDKKELTRIRNKLFRFNVRKNKNGRDKIDLDEPAERTEDSRSDGHQHIE